MEPEEEPSKEDIKNALRVLAMMNANMKNWKYVSVNAEYLDKKQVADALEQIHTQFQHIIPTLQSAVELIALTKLDPIDLI